jgi:histone H3/H4
MENENNNAGGESQEVLIVASKLKNYIRSKSGMNTSATVIDALSSKVRQLCDQAIENAKQDGRKTVMDRDFA